MSKPVRHHYLPQFYLRSFCRDGYLWLRDFQEGIIARVTPKKTAAIDDYYTVAKEGNKDTQVEELLSRIESTAAPAIAKASERKRLNIEDRDSIGLFAAFMLARVPHFRKLIADQIPHYLLGQAQEDFGSIESALACIDQYEKETGWPANTSPEELVAFVAKAELPPASDEGTMAAMLWTAMDLFPTIIKHEFLFWHCPPNLSFVTTDSPFVVIPPQGMPTGSRYGVVTDGAHKLLPLTHSTCLCLMGNGSNYAHKIADQRTTRIINQAIASNPPRLLIARDKPLLEKLSRHCTLPRSSPKHPSNHPEKD